jgi:hypothetical protein
MGIPTANLGHEDQFPPPNPSGRCRLGEATFAGMGSKEEDAPIPVVRAITIESPESTRRLYSMGFASG